MSSDSIYLIMCLLSTYYVARIELMLCLHSFIESPQQHNGVRGSDCPHLQTGKTEAKRCEGNGLRQHHREWQGGN